jgi:hypothetical protein
MFPNRDEMHNDLAAPGMHSNDEPVGRRGIASVFGEPLPVGSSILSGTGISSWQLGT